MARRSRSRKSRRTSRKPGRKLSAHRLNSLVKLAENLGLSAKHMKKRSVLSKLRRSGTKRFHKSRRTTTTSRKACKRGSYRSGSTSRCRKRGVSHKKAKY